MNNPLPFEGKYSKGKYDVWLMPWIRNRIAHNQNVLGLFIGPTGSGKSYAAMELAYTCDSTFDPDKRVYFDVTPFIQEVVRGKLQRGNALLLDDAGVFMNARDWQSIQNKAISIVAQSFRYRNFVTFITVPKWKYVDAQTRGLFNIIFEATDEQGTFKIFLPKEIHKSLNNTDDFLVYPRIAQAGLKIYVPIAIKTVHFDLPPKSISDKYEKVRATMIHEKQEEVLQELEDKLAKKNNSKGETKEEKKKGIIDLIKSLSAKGLSQRDIADVLGINQATINRLLHS